MKVVSIPRFLFIVLLSATMQVWPASVGWELQPTNEATGDFPIWRMRRTDKSLYFDLPTSVLGKDILVMRTVKGEGGDSVTLVQWQKKGDEILLLTYVIRQFDDPLGKGLPGETNYVEPRLIASFRIERISVDGTTSIDVTPLFTNIFPNWFDNQISGPRALEFNKTVAFPDNAVIQSTIETKSEKSTLAKKVSWNFVRLPERPMIPRLRDRRMPQMWNGFSLGKFSDPRPDELTLMERFRLEKRDPSQAISEPIKPVVIHIDSTTPRKWRRYLVRAVEAWSLALEAAGFRNALQARHMPENDPEWRLDVRHNYLIWNDPSKRGWPKGYRQETHDDTDVIVDPRTGEILRSGFPSHSSNAIEGILPRYIVRTAAIDPRAREYPPSDELVGEIIQAVATHEIGHMLGLMDGSYGKFVYTVNQVRSPGWVAKMGFSPSIMNYTRANSVVQPEDCMPIEYLMWRMGPTDRYAMRISYEVFPTSTSATAEREAMNNLLSLQTKEPMYRFSRFISASDPSRYLGPDIATEVVETSDPVESTRLGLANLKRSVSVMSRPALVAVYSHLFTHWTQMMQHVASIVGGYTRFHRIGTDHHAETTAIPASDQRKALAFLMGEAMQPPLFLVSKEITKMLPDDLENQNKSNIKRIVQAQSEVLETLLDANRVRRLAEAEPQAGRSVDDPKALGLAETLVILRKEIWSELRVENIEINRYRQGLQESHLNLMKKMISDIQPSEAYIKNILQTEMKFIAVEIAEASPRAKDPIVAVHLKRMQQLAQSGS